MTRGPLPARKALEYAVQIARGLAAAHDKGIVHRDLKPENVFLTADGRVKILDFGLARQTCAVAGAARWPPTLAPTDPGTVIGTVGYMAPEQVRGEAAVDARADLFALGAVLYEMLTGRRAFHRETAADTMTAILRDDPPPPPARAMPPAIDRIVRHCLEKNREARFQSARDLAFALEAIVSAPSTGVTAPPADLSMAVPRRKWAAAAIAVAAGVALTAAAFALGRRTSGETSSRPLPTFRQLTFNRGLVPMARFAPGRSHDHLSAPWNGGAPRLFSSHGSRVRARRHCLCRARCCMPCRGPVDIAMGLADEAGSVLATTPRTLAQAPILSTAVRPLLDQVTYADWSPADGALAVVRVAGSHQRLEFPLGHLLFETDGDIGYPRVSPGGDRVAFAEWPVKDDDRGSVAIRRDGRHEADDLARLGRRPRPRLGAERPRSMVHGRDGRHELRALGCHAGRNRARDPADSGRAPAPRHRARWTTPAARLDRTTQVNVWRAGDQAERDGSWLDFSYVRDLSADGRRLLLTYSGEGSGSSYDVFVRALDQDAIRIGEGQAQQFSPDGRSALAIVHGPPARLVALPIAPASRERSRPAP